MRVKVVELAGSALDWAVAKCEGVTATRNFPGLAYIPKGKRTYFKWAPSTNWKQGGPIIEREEIGVRLNRPCSAGREWEASPSPLAKGAGGKWGYGPTPLIAAIRCYVASKLGDEVDVPDELLKA